MIDFTGVETIFDKTALFSSIKREFSIEIICIRFP